MNLGCRFGSVMLVAVAVAACRPAEPTASPTPRGAPIATAVPIVGVTTCFGAEALTRARPSHAILRSEHTLLLQLSTGDVMSVDLRAGECRVLSPTIGCFHSITEVGNRVFGLSHVDHYVVELTAEPPRAERVDLVSDAESVSLTGTPTELLVVTRREILRKKLDGARWEKNRAPATVSAVYDAVVARTRLFTVVNAGFEVLGAGVSSVEIAGPTRARAETVLELAGGVTDIALDPKEPDCVIAVRRTSELEADLLRVCRTAGTLLTDGRLDVLRSLSGKYRWSLIPVRGDVVVSPASKGGLMSLAGAEIPVEATTTTCGFSFTHFANGLTLVTNPHSRYPNAGAFYEEAR